MKRFFAYSTVGTVLIILFGGFFLLNRLMQFRGELASLKDQGFPVAIADLEISPEADQVDATKQFSRLLGTLGSFESEMYGAYDGEHPVDEKTIKLFNDLNAAYPTVYPLIAEVTNAGFVGFETKDVGDHDMLDRVQQIRSCARVLHFKAKVLAAQEKPDQALNSVMEIFKLCETFEKHPSLIAHLVRCACRGLAIGSAYDILSEHEVTAQTREQLNELLENFESSDDYRRTLVSERAVGSSLLSEMGTMSLAFGGIGYLDLIGKELEQCDKEAFEKDLTFENNISWLDGGHATAMIMPALRQTRIANSRVKSRMRGLRIINALTANAESIEKEFTKEYLIGLGVPESMTVDTMNGEVLKVKRKDDQWVVYSVGEDLVDDGGNAKLAKDFVVGSR